MFLGCDMPIQLVLSSNYGDYDRLEEVRDYKICNKLCNVRDYEICNSM